MKRWRTIFSRRWLAHVCIAAVLLAVTGVAVFYALVRLLPFPSALTSIKPSSTWINDRNGTAMAACVAVDDQWRFPLREDQISPHLQRAIVAVEDERFFSHHGVDWKSVLGSAWENISSFRTRRGASTLTMQVVRLRMPAQRSLTNKYMQAVRAQQLEQRRTKRQILIDYINEAPFGGNLVGAGAASWRYFRKPCSQLSLAEAALLAGLPQQPNTIRPDRFPDRAKVRRDLVLLKMRQLRMIDDDAYAQAVAEPVNARWHPLPQMKDASDGALPTLMRIAELYRGQTVTLTLDPTVQQTAASLARDHLEPLKTSGVNSAAVVVLDTQTSELLAGVSINDRHSKADLTRAMRSTGSTLKPFIYAAAVDAGLITMSSKIDDSAKAWATYTPVNFDKSFRGELTAAQALAESRNIPAMTILSRVGIARTINVLGACGIKSVTISPQRYGLPLAIGGAEASPLQIAEAYATLARGGEHKDIRYLAPSPCTRGEGWGEGRTANGPVDNAILQSANAAPHPNPLPDYRERELPIPFPVILAEAQDAPLTKDTCFQILAALSKPERTATISPDAATKQVAWKTGTSSGRRDAWCAAVTPRLTVVVWLGNEKGESSPLLIGTDAAAPLALKLISTLDHGTIGFPAPQNESATLAAAALSRTKVAILSPANGDQLILDPDSHSTVSLQAHHTRGDEKLWWFVDGNAIEGDRWIPSPGSHEIRLVDSEGVSAISRIIVRKE